MVYSDKPPYDIVQNDLIPFALMQKMKRFARFWDMVYNSGNFKRSCELLWKEGKVFEGFYAFSEWLYTQTESTWQIALDRLAELVFRYLCEEQGYEKERIKAQLIEDIMTVRGRKMPSFLRDNYVPRDESEENTIKVNKRQLKHANAV
ncbi:MAG: DUF4080 domain-containing protein [Sulfurospirillum cavolei]|nr:DUF4080 domain-containing protein [Sulfurospirillum cavolei]